jgi:hypothetical protein
MRNHLILAVMALLVASPAVAGDSEDFRREALSLVSFEASRNGGRALTAQEQIESTHFLSYGAGAVGAYRGLKKICVTPGMSGGKAVSKIARVMLSRDDIAHLDPAAQFYIAALQSFPCDDASVGSRP